MDPFMGYKILTVGLVFLAWGSTMLASAASHHWLLCSVIVQPKVWIDECFNLGEGTEGSSQSPYLCPCGTPGTAIAGWDIIPRRRVSGWVLESIRESKTQIQKRLFKENPYGEEKKKRKEKQFPWLSALLTLQKCFLSVPV